MICNLLQTSVIRFQQAKGLVNLYWEGGLCRHCSCSFLPTELLRQQVKILQVEATKFDKPVLAYKK